VVDRRDPAARSTHGPVIAIKTLHFPDEVRDPDVLVPFVDPPSRSDMKQARAIISALRADLPSPASSRS